MSFAKASNKKLLNSKNFIATLNNFFFDQCFIDYSMKISGLKIFFKKKIEKSNFLYFIFTLLKLFPL